jgi:hypothetical protein
MRLLLDFWSLSRFETKAYKTQTSTCRTLEWHPDLTAMEKHEQYRQT